MEFSNVITISDIINTIVLIFSSITILLTYLTLIEMKKQRNISILPNIFIKYNSEIIYNTKNMRSEHSKFNLSIQNNGNSIAKNIKCTLCIRELENEKFNHLKFSNNSLYYDFKDYVGFYTSNCINKDIFIQTLQNGNPYTINTDSIENTIKCIAKSLIESHQEDMNKNELIEEWNRFNRKLLLTVYYTDIIGNNYNINFDLSLIPSSVSYENGTVHYSLQISNIYKI